MACSLTITSVTGVGTPGSAPTLIRVSGTATECREVKVEVDCHGPPFGDTAPVTGGTWTVELPVPADSNCRCLGPIFVRATCVHDESCTTTFQGEIPCEPGGKCPQVNVNVAVGDCNANGTRNVTLTATITPPTAATGVAQWSFGDGTIGGAFTFTGPTTNVTVHGYPPGGPYTASLAIILPEGCPPTNVTVGPLDPCDCPEIIDLTATVTGCAGSGSTATVTLVGTIPGSPSGCTYHWDFGDGTPDVTTPGPSATHSYATAGTFAVAVTIVCGACVRTTTVSVTVPPCCPVVTALSATVEGCIGDGKTATVTFIATTNPSGASGSFSWSFGDGGSTTTTVPTVTHTYASVGTFPAQVTFTPSQAGCPATTAAASVNISPCDGGTPPPPPPDGDGGGCTGLRWAGVILSILAALAFYIWICVPGAGSAFGYAAAAFAVAAAILFALWWFLCPKKPCRAGLLIAWQIALGAGIGALYFAPCCPFLWVIGAALIAAALAGLIAWWRACRKTFCQVAAELGIVITVVIVPVLGWLAGIPFLAACLNPIVAASVSTLSAAIAAALAKCAME